MSSGQQCFHLFSAHLRPGGCARTLNQESEYLGSILYQPHTFFLTLGSSLSPPDSLFSRLQNERVGQRDLGFASSIERLGYAPRSFSLYFK